MAEPSAIDRLIAETGRSIGDRPHGDGEARTLVIQRRYRWPASEVWAAVTDPDRLRRFFLPLTGDLEPGGTFQLEGGASGEILLCEPPRLLRVTWIRTERPPSELVVRLHEEPEGGTVLELGQAPIPALVELKGRQVDPMLNDAESGIWGMGTGWEMALAALAVFLNGGGAAAGEPSSPPHSASAAPAGPPPEILELGRRIGEAWASLVDPA